MRSRVWTQSDGVGRALVTAARPPGGAFGAPTTVLPSSEQVLTVRALGSSAGDVLVAFVVGARRRRLPGPLRALRLGPDGLAASSVRTLTPPGERTRDVALAADGSAGWAAWATGGTRAATPSASCASPARSSARSAPSRAPTRAVAARPAFAMTARSRALIAYATTSGRIRLVTKRAGL